MSEGLVDLSLFSFSPADDSHFALPTSPALPGRSSDASDHFTSFRNGNTEFYAPKPAPAERNTWKPLPPSPPRMNHDPAPPTQPEARHSSQSNRMKRKRTRESPGTPENSLPRRRNVTGPPQLLLSRPNQPRADNNPVSELVWMPEEQMWLVVGEGERAGSLDNCSTQIPRQRSGQGIDRTRSEPATRIQSGWTTTPPMSPIQNQLRSLIEQRDNERLSPLFQEAMNSVPMDDLHDPPPPPTYEGTLRDSMRSMPESDNYTHDDTSSAPNHWPPLLQRPSSFNSHFQSAGSNPRDSTFSDMTSISRNQTYHASAVRLKSVTSKFGVWTAPDSWNVISRRSQREPSSNDPEQGRDHLVQDPAGSRSWSGWARKFARPRSST